jgi:hypothetical protein
MNQGDTKGPSWGSSGNANDAGIGWKLPGTYGTRGTSGYGASNAGSYGPFQKDLTTPEVAQSPTELGLPNSGGMNYPKWGDSSSVNDEAGGRYGYGAAAAASGQAGYGNQYTGAYTSYPKDLTTPKVVQAPTRLGLPNLGGMNYPKWGDSGTVDDEAGGRYSYVMPATGYGRSSYMVPGYGANAGPYTSSLKDFTTPKVVQSPTQVRLGLQNLGGPAWQYSYASNDSPGGEGY